MKEDLSMLSTFLFEKKEVGKIAEDASNKCMTSVLIEFF